MNEHDLDGFVDCFAEDFSREYPAYPDRGFVGREYVRTIWENVFELSPTFRVDLLQYVYEGDTVWAHWYWHDVPTGAGVVDICGVTIMHEEAGRYTSAVFHMVPVHETDACFMPRLEETAAEPD